MHYSIVFASLAALAAANSHYDESNFGKHHLGNRFGHGPTGRRCDRLDRQGRCDNDRRYNGLMETIFGNKYECMVDARSIPEEEEATRRCCHELGGRLFEHDMRVSSFTHEIITETITLT